MSSLHSDDSPLLDETSNSLVTVSQSVDQANDILTNHDWIDPTPLTIMMVARELRGSKMDTDQINDWIKAADRDGNELYQLQFGDVRQSIRLETVKEERLVKASGQYWCKDEKCGSQRVTVIEEQLRGGDEAKTTFINCTECNQRFKVA